MTRGARALVLCPDIRALRYDLDAAERLAEAEGLALAIGVVIAHSAILPVRQMQPNTLFGSGQVENIATWCEQHAAELVIVDGALSPIQQRNLEDRLKRKVIDRTGLFSRFSANALRQPKAASRSNLPISIISRAALSAAGPTLNVNAGASASSAGLARPRSRPTGA